MAFGFAFCLPLPTTPTPLNPSYAPQASKPHMPNVTRHLLRRPVRRPAPRQLERHRQTRRRQTADHHPGHRLGRRAVGHGPALAASTCRTKLALACCLRRAADRLLHPRRPRLPQRRHEPVLPVDARLRAAAGRRRRHLAVQRTPARQCLGRNRPDQRRHPVHGRQQQGRQPPPAAVHRCGHRHLHPGRAMP